MNKWAWCHEYEQDARARGDAERLRLARLHYEGWNFRETDPDQAHALYDQGCQLAKRLGEPWWALFYTHWRLGSLLYFKRDYRDVVGQAVEAVLEVRKPRYDAFTFRFAIYYDLISAYIGIDPAGYADRIRDALHSLEYDVPRSGEDYYLLEDSKRAFALALEDLDAAEAATVRSMRAADEAGEPESLGHHMAFNYCALCHIAFKRNDWERLAEFAAAGEQTAQRIGYKLQISECQMWLALLARRNGDEAKAQPLRLQAASRVSRVKKPPSAAWFNALCAWAVYENDLPAALRVRDRELETIRGHGRLSYESYCHLERCRLLARMGRPLDEVLAAGRAAAARLRDPAPELEKLDRMARGLEGQGAG
jgi:hypothetical protein